MSRRAQIQMTTADVRALLAEERTVICASNGKDGFPHLMPLWFVVRDDELWSWTFAKSQKVRNLERDPRATLQVEAGRDYHELRGVMLKTDVAIHRDTDEVVAFGLELFAPLQRGAHRRGSRDGERAGAQARRAAVLRALPRDVGPPQARRGHLLVTYRTDR